MVLSLRFGLALTACLASLASAGQGAATNAGQQQASSRQQALEVAWSRELEDLEPKKHASPVQRVVALLGKMKEELEKEAEKETEMYDKMVCWCEANEKEKTGAVSDAEVKDESLSAEIEGRGARLGELSAGIDQMKIEIADHTTTLKKATAIREKEASEFKEEEKDMVQAVTNMRNAIAVLSKHQGGGKAAAAAEGSEGSFVQIDAPVLSGIRVLLRDAASKYEMIQARRAERRAHGKPLLAAFLQRSPPPAASLSLLDEFGLRGGAKEVLPLDLAANVVARAAKPVRKSGSSGNFLQASDTMPVYSSYSSSSSGVYGLLTQMLDEFTAELSDLQKAELKAHEDYKALADAKTAQIETGKVKLDDMEVEDAENVKALSDAKEDLSITRDQRSEDVKFLQNLKLTCNDLDDQWRKRSATRSAETTAVAEAIAILTEDDNREHLAKSVDFLQVRSASAAEARQRAQRRSAVAFLRRAAEAPDFEADDLLAAWHGRAAPALGAAGGPRAQLSTLAVSVQLDAFEKVKEMIDKMAAELKKQQADEVTHKKNCEDNLNTNEKTLYSKGETKKDLEAKMESLEALMQTLSDEMAEAKKQIAASQVEVKKAGEARELENKEFQTVVSDQRATQTILQKAVGKLKDFYEKGINNRAALVQVRSKQEPPMKFNAYKTNAGSNSVIGLIEQIVEDSKALEAEATKGENEAQKSYETFVKDSNGMIESLKAAIQSKTKASSAAKSDHALHGADHESTVSELQSLTEYKADLHNQCDFVLKNFDIRQKARLQEIEAIVGAKSILSGDRVSGGGAKTEEE